MEERIRVPDLCRACQLKKKEAEARQVKEEKADPLRKRREALARVERCKFFCHHGLYDADGKDDPLCGRRTCSLAVTCGCGHEELKYNLCDDWFDGKLCNDWAEKT